MNSPTLPPLSFNHWGLFHPEVESGRVVGMRPFAADLHPVAFGASLVDAVHSPLRITQPMVREGWLTHGPG
ncbi:hypothetical protein, partial [Immundisolibacter sp.]|uniref:hypothetical protein n=1 Tax=Immundisolibacter sp. TaxID=1934948 RepID=UPI003566DE70